MVVGRLPSQRGKICSLGWETPLHKWKIENNIPSRKFCECDEDDFFWGNF